MISIFISLCLDAEDDTVHPNLEIFNADEHGFMLIFTECSLLVDEKNSSK